ncbi:type II/IV secretion system protein [Clostridium sp. P21]|uniref:Type II/IV secretion system protein n=1 Tax=Clostridium muellerianum TaxID=2716538 RepID=A0A7Y0HMW6_9CLOT|nr:GspE/PulE family protein [Clostridium muellerianum]NMM61396.1 type II/IV secretion system protein [Clostridium muellerianum]
MENERLENIHLETVSIEDEVVKRVPENIARENCLIAFKENNGCLNIAINKEPDIFLKDELKFISNKELKFFYEDKNIIINAINTYYCKCSMEKAIKTIKTEKEFYNTKNHYQFKNDESLQEAPAVKIINSIINAAISERASDIHLEPFQNDILVRFRIDGIINYFTKIPKDIYSLVCTRLKIMASIDISEKRIPQDGKIKYTYENENYDFRISILPTILGEKIVIRILYKSKDIKVLDSLGFFEKDVAAIRNMIRNSHGIILVTGPTGSGKTTTLYSILNTLNKMENNITSIEDPVECIVDNINQVKVNNKIGFTFAQGLKSILRQDPDVIMIGEIRDEETAHIAIRAAITGHLVLSTLHTNSAIESALRLLDMGIPSYFIEDALVGVIAQRLVRKICPYCRKAYYPSDCERKYLNLDSSVKLYKGTGCYKCRGTGYKGRTVVYEIIDIRDIKDFNIISKKYTQVADNSNLNKYITSMRDNCIELIKKGVTTYDELMRLNF